MANETTKAQFEAALEAAGISMNMEPRVEVDGAYKYECWDDVDGKEIAFITWHDAQPTYTVREA